MDRPENERQFLIELEALTRKHKLIVGGCGCCGSPFLSAAEEEELDGLAGYGNNSSSDIAWISPNDDYDWKRYKSSIVRGD